jgi:hypothetical protein
MGENPLADDFAPGRQPRRGAWLLKYSGLGSACRIRDSACQELNGESHCPTNQMNRCAARVSSEWIGHGRGSFDGPLDCLGVPPSCLYVAMVKVSPNLFDRHSLTKHLSGPPPRGGCLLDPQEIATLPAACHPAGLSQAGARARLTCAHRGT